MDSKICKICTTEKSINDFRPKRKVCKECCNRQLCLYRENNLAKVKRIKNDWRANNKVKETNRTKKWRYR